MKAYITSIALLAIIFILGHRVSGKCNGPPSVNQGTGYLDTPWATCLPSESSEEKCPHGFLKLADNAEGCYSKVTRAERYPYVCCLLTPLVDLKIKDAPCLSNVQSPASRSTQDVHDSEED